jgi:uncharacterized membrane protein
MMNGYHMDGWDWSGIALMAVVTVAIVGLLVSLLVRQFTSRAASARGRLDARLARGAIDTEEYRKRLDARDA